MTREQQRNAACAALGASIRLHVYIVHIRFKHGDDLTVHLSEDDAMDYVDAYVQDQWLDAFGIAGDPDFVVLPSNRDDRIEKYFDQMSHDESWISQSQPFEVPLSMILKEEA